MIRRAWQALARAWAAEVTGWHTAQAIIADVQAQTPSPGPRSMPGDGPAPRLLMSSRFYSDGVVFVDDHIKRQTTRFDPPGEDGGADLSDEAIARFLDGHH